MRKGLLALTLGVILLVTLSGCVAGRPKQELPSRPIEISRELAEKAWDKIYRAQQQTTFSLTFTESELTSLLVFTLKEKFKDQPLREPRIWIESDRVIFATTLVDLVPTSLNLVVEFRLYADNGAVKVQFLKMLVNKRPLPAVTLRMLSRIASETLAEAKLMVYVDEIRLERGVLLIRGRIIF